MMRTWLHRKYFLVALVLILKLHYCLGAVKYPESLEGLSLQTDIGLYMNALDRLLKLCEREIRTLDVNFYFGLFLLNVNLRHAVSPGFSKDLETGLRQTVARIDNLLRLIMFNIDITRYPARFIALLLFTNPDMWARDIGRYDSDNHEVVFKSKAELEQKYYPWAQYVQHIDDHTNTPNQALVDKCFASLAGNEIKATGPPNKCSLLQECYAPIRNGTGYGSALCFRALTLIAARLGRGCYIFSPTEDEQLTTTFCADMFDEGQFIATNSYKRPELLAEQVGICSLVGHMEFIRRPWLSEALKRQRPTGCFDPSWPHTVKQQCDNHYTAAAARALGAALRFVLVTYF